MELFKWNKIQSAWMVIQMHNMQSVSRRTTKSTYWYNWMSSLRREYPWGRIEKYFTIYCRPFWKHFYFLIRPHQTRTSTVKRFPSPRDRSSNVKIALLPMCVLRFSHRFQHHTVSDDRVAHLIPCAIFLFSKCKH